jgi:PmbA protein
MSDLLDVLDRVLAQAGPSEAVEVFGIDQVSTSARAYGGEVESLSSAHTRGVGIRVVDDYRVGYAHTSDLSEAALASALEDARANARATTPDEANVLAEPAPAEPIDDLWSPGADAVPADRKVAIALELEAAVRGAGPPVKGIRMAIYGDQLSEAAIASTTGVRGGYRRSDAYVIVEALAEDDGAGTSAFGLSAARHPDAVDVEAAAGEAVSRATRLLGGRQPESGRMPIVLDPHVTASLLSVVGAGLSAEAVQRGRSLFAGRVGERLGPDFVTLIDDGRLRDGFSSAPWDGEGVPTRRTTLIDRGVLRGFLHNCQSARRDGTTSTGNASRGSHQNPPGLGPTNLYLEAGDAPPERLVGGVERGFYCQQVMGLHSGANPISGELSVAAAGLMIRDGQFAEPVREATIAGTIPRLLAGVAEIGSDLRIFPQHGSTGGQTVLVDEMTLAGA